MPIRLVAPLWLVACTREPPAGEGSHDWTAPSDPSPTSTAPDPSTTTPPTTPTTTPSTPTTPSTTTTPSTPTTEPLPTQIRVVTWNVETLGARGDDQYDAVLSVLARIDADVVALNEIDAYEEDDVADLAYDLGLETVVVASTNPFGSLHNAVLTRLPAAATTIWTSDALSGDPDANDVTRWPVAVQVETANGPLTVVSEHWKSGFEVVDEFRRVMDSERVAQAAAIAGADAAVALGDMNAELGEIGIVPTWYYVPVDAPSSYVLGDDLQAELDAAGIPNDVFAPLAAAGLAKVAAAQRDGELATRDVSGRIIDHLFAGARVAVVGAEVYDARDDALAGLPLAGVAPDVGATAAASDHFPVFADLTVIP